MPPLFFYSVCLHHKIAVRVHFEHQLPGTGILLVLQENLFVAPAAVGEPALLASSTTRLIFCGVGTFSPPLKDSILGNEIKSSRIHAVTLTGRFGPVVKYVTEMRVTDSTQYLRAAHEQGVIRLTLDIFFANGSVETRPTGTGIELCVRLK